MKDIPTRSLSKIEGTVSLEERFISLEDSSYSFCHRSIYNDAENDFYPPHIHDCYEIYVKKSGDISFMVDNIMYSLDDLDVVITHPGDLHNAIANSYCTHDHYCLWFSSGSLKDFLDKKRIHGVVRLTAEKKSKLQRTLDRCEETEHKLISTMAILQLLVLISESEEEVEALAMPEKLQDILKYIDENLVTVRGSQEIAENFSISVSTLNRLFSQNLHTTVHTLIEKKRLAYAKHLLNVGRSATDACFAAGFQDFSRFISKFRREFGMTPAKYRSIYHSGTK
jgi:AraC-like DNA-binding protein